MRRRVFIGGIGAAVAMPYAQAQQQTRRPLIGWINSGMEQAFSAFTTQWHVGIQSTGFTEGRNLDVIYHWTNGALDRIPHITAELLGRGATLLSVWGTATDPAIKAAAANPSVPIVFGYGSDPVWSGHVQSLNRPGGRTTGVTSMSFALVAKRVGLLHEVLPASAAIGFLTNPTNRDGDSEARDMETAAAQVGRRLVQVNAGNPHDLNDAIANARTAGVGALVIGTDTLFFAQAAALAEHCLRHRMPAIGPLKSFAAAGGLVSYGSDIAYLYRHAGVYTGRILKGERPADLPVYQPTRFHIVFNLKTAKALGLDLPATLLAIADEVIE